MHKPLPQDFPDSPYARELFGDLNALRFAPSLEIEYGNAHLLRVRRRMRLFFALLCMVAVSYTATQVGVHGWSNPFSVAHWAVLLPAAALLLGMSWSRRFRELYRPVGAWTGGVFNVTLSILIAHSLLHGNSQDLAVLAVNIVAIFFFSGFMFRPAVLICACSLFAFVATGALLGMPPGELVKSLLVTGMTAIIASVIYHDVEQSYRVSFLESALIDDMIARDGLSGLMNRRAFDDHLDRIWKHALRDRRSITVFMIDVDGLGRYNELHGREAGDGALRRVAQDIREFGRRPLDLAARYDGAKFALVLYDLAAGHVSDMAERLRQRVSDMRIGELTVSIGVSLAVPALGRSPQGLINLAAEAVGEAKQAGRDRVVFKGEHSFAPLQTGAYKLPRAGRLARTS